MMLVALQNRLEEVISRKTSSLHLFSLGSSGLGRRM